MHPSLQACIGYLEHVLVVDAGRTLQGFVSTVPESPSPGQCEPMGRSLLERRRNHAPSLLRERRHVHQPVSIESVQAERAAVHEEMSHVGPHETRVTMSSAISRSQKCPQKQAVDEDFRMHLGDLRFLLKDRELL